MNAETECFANADGYGTVMCARVSEAALLRVCNVHPDIDAPFNPAYRGGIGIKIVKRKNDVKRRGIIDSHPARSFGGASAQMV